MRVRGDKMGVRGRQSYILFPQPLHNNTAQSLGRGCAERAVEKIGKNIKKVYREEVKVKR